MLIKTAIVKSQKKPVSFKWKASSINNNIIYNSLRATLPFTNNSRKITVRPRPTNIRLSWKMARLHHLTESQPTQAKGIACIPLPRCSSIRATLSLPTRSPSWLTTPSTSTPY